MSWRTNKQSKAKYSNEGMRFEYILKVIQHLDLGRTTNESTVSELSHVQYASD